MLNTQQRAKWRAVDFPFARPADLKRMHSLTDFCDILAVRKVCRTEDWLEMEWSVIPDAPTVFHASLPPPASLPEARSASSGSLQPKVEIITNSSQERCVRFRCCVESCGKLYSSKYRCGMHMIACHTGETDRPFMCTAPGCPKAYATKDSLTRHRRVSGHTGEIENKDKKPDEAQSKEEANGGNTEHSGELKNRVQELVDLFDEF